MKLDYSIGDIVEYHSTDGLLRRARVIERLHSSRPGESGFDGILLDHKEKHIFAYDHQITCVISRAPIEPINQPIDQSASQSVDSSVECCPSCQLYQNGKCKDGHFVGLKHCYWLNKKGE